MTIREMLFDKSLMTIKYFLLALSIMFEDVQLLFSRVSYLFGRILPTPKHKSVDILVIINSAPHRTRTPCWTSRPTSSTTGTTSSSTRKATRSLTSKSRKSGRSGSSCGSTSDHRSRGLIPTRSWAFSLSYLSVSGVSLIRPLRWVQHCSFFNTYQEK